MGARRPKNVRDRKRRDSTTAVDVCAVPKVKSSLGRPRNIDVFDAIWPDCLSGYHKGGRIEPQRASFTTARVKESCDTGDRKNPGGRGSCRNSPSIGFVRQAFF